MNRRSTLFVAALAAAPLLTAALAVRSAPAGAAESFAPFGFYSLTGSTGGARTAGDVGAGGGLVTLDSGSASVTGRLDSGPSSAVRAAAIEPGTLVRTIIGVANTSAGSTIFTTPDADVSYPGTSSARTTTAGPQAVGPLIITGGDAQARAEPTRASGSALGAELDLPGVLHVGGSFSSMTLRGEKETGHYLAAATSDVAVVSIADTLLLRNVSASATIEANGAKTVPKASLTIGAASVAGTPVIIDSDGVHAVGEDVSAAGLKALQDGVNAALAAANIEVRAFDVVQTVKGRSAVADTGGVLISVKTPDLPAGITGNSFSIALGKTTLTGTSNAQVSATVPNVAPVTSPTDQPLVEESAPVPTAYPSDPVATLAPTPSAAQARHNVVVIGRTMSARTALAAFACWQLLSLAGATLYAMLDRRRRLRSLEQS